MYPTFLAIATAFLLAGTVAVGRLEGIVERLAETRTSWAVVAAPTALQLCGFAALATVSPLIGIEVALAVAGSVGGAIVALLASSMAATRYASHVVDRATIVATWRAPWPDRSRRPIRYLAGATAVLGAVGLIVGIGSDREIVRMVGNYLVPFGAFAVSIGRERTYRATDRGLEVRAPVARRLYAWDTFDGYRATDDGIVLRRPDPWRLSRRCALDSIEDPDGVLTALDAHLERRY